MEKRVMWVLIVLGIAVFLILAYQSVMFSPFSRVVKSGGPLESGVESGLGSDLADNQVPDDGGGHGGFGEERPPFERREKPSEGDECESDDDCRRCEYCQEGVCVPKEEMCADFKIEKLVSVDPVSGEETWEEIPLPNEDAPVEKGLKIRFDASVSSGDIALFSWRYGNTPMQGEEEAIYQCTQTGDVTLSLYSADWMEWDQITKTVSVDSGMEQLACSNYPGEDLTATASCSEGTELWAVGQGGLLGWADFADPNNPQGANLMDIEPLNAPRELTTYGGYVYIANRGDGVPIYRADPFDFELLGMLSLEELGGDPADCIVRVQDTLYIGSKSSSVIRVFDLTNPTDPVFVTSFLSQGYIWSMDGDGEDYVAVRNGANFVSIIDTTNPRSPILGEQIQLTDGEAGMTVSAGESSVAATIEEGTQFVAIRKDVNGNVYGELAGFIEEWSRYYGYAGDRIFWVKPGAGIRKGDVTNPYNPYFMEELHVSNIVISTADAIEHDDGEVSFVYGYSPHGFCAVDPNYELS